MAKNNRFNKSKFKFKGKSFKGTNDFSWYNKDPLLSKLASVVNFLHPIGQNFYLGRNTIIKPHQSTAPYTSDLLPESIPGIMPLLWMPTPGVSLDATSPINVSGARRFTKMREKNWSGSTAYDIPDVSFTLLAADSLFSAYAFLLLAYTHMMEYKFTNRYYPRGIIEALGLDFDDLQDNMADFIAFIDITKKKMENLKVPKNISYIARHMHMSAYVYKDHRVEKAQLYVFAPKYLLQYDPTTPALVYVDWHPTIRMKLSDIKTKFNAMLNALVPDEDSAIQFSDIMKFVSDSCWEVKQIDWGTQAEPIYDEEMLWQIHNADFLSYVNVSNLNIVQTIDSNLNTVIHWDPEFESTEFMMVCKRVIDSNVDDPSGQEIVESTRLKFTLREPESIALPSTVNGTFKFHLGSCGSEILLNASIIANDPNDGNKLIEKPITTFVKSHIGTATFDGQNYNVVAFDFNPTDPNWGLGSDITSVLGLSAFNFRPIIYVGIQRKPGTGMENIYLGLQGEISNIAIIEDHQLEVLHEICLLSEFDA